MEILKRTPRTEMRYEALLRKVLTVWDEMIKGEDEDSFVLDLAVTQYARLSSRISTSDVAELGFELASPHDSAEEIRDKFLRYLHEADLDKVDAVEKAIQRYDAPIDPATAPDPLPDSAEKN